MDWGSGYHCHAHTQRYGPRGISLEHHSSICRYSGIPSVDCTGKEPAAVHSKRDCISHRLCRVMEGIWLTFWQFDSILLLTVKQHTEKESET